MRVKSRGPIAKFQFQRKKPVVPNLNVGLQEYPSQLKWRLEFPGATLEAPWVPRHNSSETPNFPLQLEKNHKNPPLSQVEAILFLQGLESNPEFPLKTPQEAWLPLGHSKGSKRYPSQLERWAEFFAPTRDKAWLHLQRNPDVPITPHEEAGLTLKLQKNSRGRSTIWKDTMSPSTRHKALFPCNDSNATSSINS